MNKMNVFGDCNNKYNIPSLNESDQLKFKTNQVGTSKGVLLKWNFIKDGRNYFIKAGSSNGIILSPLEPIAEVISYKLGKLLGVNVVPTAITEIDINEGYYGLKKQTALVSYTEDFKTSKFNKFIPAIQLIDIKNFNYNSLGPTLTRFKEELNKMLMFDFIIGNYDRHLNNFGVLANSDMTEMVFAPIFDNGSSLLNQYNNDDLMNLNPKDVDKYSTAKPFNLTQTKQVNLINPLPEINLEINHSEITDIVNEFIYDLPEYRRKRIINFIERRLMYARKIYSKG